MSPPRARLTEPLSPLFPVKVAARDGFIEVNPLARWGKTRIWRATRTAIRKGWLRRVDRVNAGRHIFEATDAGRRALSEDPK